MFSRKRASAIDCAPPTGTRFRPRQPDSRSEILGSAAPRRPGRRPRHPVVIAVKPAAAVSCSCRPVQDIASILNWPVRRTRSTAEGLCGQRATGEAPHSFRGGRQMADQRTTGAEGVGAGAEGVTYESVGIEYFEKRTLRRHARAWSLWALGVGAVISGDFFGWNYGLATGGFGGLLIATVIVSVMYVCLCYSLAEMSPA